MEVTAMQNDRPQPLLVQPENMPAALKERHQWVNWKYELTQDGKWTKVPYIAGTTYRASSTNPQTWRTFDEAIDAYRADGFDGIGFVFSADDDYAGVDLDDCIDPQTGQLKDWATNISKFQLSLAP
jgi:primase-polymerase (primpol)-like protein